VSLPVLYIGGAPRSGSTILSRLLAERQGGIAAGELNEIWKDGFLENRPCSCGKPFRACPFWAKVVHRAFGSPDRVNARQLATWTERVSANMWQSTPVPGDIVSVLTRLYRTLGRTGQVIDSSKSAGYARVLEQLPGLGVRIVHLVRDSRAVVFSWSRRTILPRLGVLQACVQWNAYNLPWTFRALAGSASLMRLRYEDFTADPDAAVARILAWCSPGRRQPASRVQAPHILSGNPVRSGRGRIRIVEEVAWRKSLRANERRLATALTWPLLAQYGYLVRPASGPPR